MTSEVITFNHLRCHSSSTALGIRTGEVQMKPPKLALRFLFIKRACHRALLQRLCLWPFLLRKTIREKKTETSFSGHTTLFSSYNAAD